MAEIKLYFADCAGTPSNCSYPHEAVITDATILRQVVRHDYVCVAYEKGYRANSNFLTTTCLGMDCDNDHSENPEEWVTPEDVRRAFPDVTFAVHFSRSSMKVKRGKQTKSEDEAQEDNDAIAMAMALLVIENTHLREVIHHLRDTISGLTDHNLL